ncbi:GtrA family protein [Streptococcus ovuberis]|uniref:GtrA family protein n=1 Tax=Streptococcus ovuberis TaxID=1936207 RepID=A0A7X6MX39_9STRE|nr:GtrA family protein [Streptococcus ovuberis]NKZ19364.1 GtrA family protein [Streptococcus ovuberis]
MRIIKHFIKSEVFIYLFFGVLATLVYTVSRTLLFTFLREATVSAVLANAVAVIFAFFTNDRFVFKQKQVGRGQRFLKFVGARLFTLFLDLALAYLLVEKYPQIIGQFVGQQLDLVNLIETLIAQVLIILLNYIISKWFVFKKPAED